MLSLRTQAGVIADWITLHPLFTVAGLLALIVILLILHRRRRAG